MNNGNDNVSSLEKTETYPSDVSPITEKPTATPPQNMQVTTKNLMINSLNSAGSDMEDSITGDSTSDLHTERYKPYCVSNLNDYTLNLAIWSQNHICNSYILSL